MDLKQLIATGLLEAYVLNQLTPEERRDIGILLAESPETVKEIRAIEEAQEIFAQYHGVLPPADLRAQVLGKIPPVAGNLEARTVRPRNTTPAKPKASASAGPDINWIPFAWIASVIIPAAAIWWYMSSNQQNLSSDQQAANATFETKIQQAAAEKDSLATLLDKANTDLGFLRNPANRPVFLPGTALAPDASAILYLNRQTGKAYLDVMKLPAVAAGKQYQLWAVVRGRNSVIGTVKLPDNTAEFAPQEISYVDGASAYLVTQEDIAASPTRPNYSAMYLYAKL